MSISSQPLSPASAVQFELSRRDFVAAVGGTLVAAWVAAEAGELLAAGRYAGRVARQVGRNEPLPPFQVLSAEQAAELEAATARIVPTDGAPGAREARVVYFIDRSLATFASDQRPTFERGVKALRAKAAALYPGARSFASLDDGQQSAVLAALARESHPFFGALRGATIVGMLSNPEYDGTHAEIGWRIALG